MSNSHRPVTGPLTPVQRQTLIGLVQGRTQREIAGELGVRESYVSAEISIGRRKLNCATTAHAVHALSTHLAYLEVARLLDATVDDADDPAVRSILEGLAQILRDRAAALIPS